MYSYKSNHENAPNPLSGLVQSMFQTLNGAMYELSKVPDVGGSSEPQEAPVPQQNQPGYAAVRLVKTEETPEAVAPLSADASNVVAVDFQARQRITPAPDAGQLTMRRDAQRQLDAIYSPDMQSETPTNQNPEDLESAA